MSPILTVSNVTLLESFILEFSNSAIFFVSHTNWRSQVRFPYSTQTCGFKNIWSRHLVKQLWPPDGCRRTEGRLSTTLAAKGCVRSFYSTKMLKVDWSKWMMTKRGMVDKQGESMFASHRYLGVSNPGLQMIGSNDCDVSCL